MHEERYIARLRSEGRSIEDLSHVRERGLAVDVALAVTVKAMFAGADVIVQAPLGDDDWFGYADVLTRVDRPSKLGDWSYEVEDTKLSRDVRGGTILQLCAYSELVGKLQEVEPERFRVVTPGGTREFRFPDFGAYYRLVKARLLGWLRQAEAEQAFSPAASAPDPVDHCQFCRWWPRCNAERRGADHIRFVAGLGRLHQVELAAQGITSLKALAGMPIPIAFKPRRGAPETYRKLREQARLQLGQRETGEPRFELLPFEKGYGLALLPEPRPGDLFLDLEGDPFAREPDEGSNEAAGREYLFGLYRAADGSGPPSYLARWAFDDEEERRAFEATIDAITAAVAADPSIHVYHYGAYDPAALKRLAGRYAVRGPELDVLLRAGRFVDLHAVVRRALRAGVEHYSIKDLEPFYAFTRDVLLHDASDQRRIVEAALETEDPSAATADVKAAVEGYNRDDCRSTLELRAWLETLRAAEIARGLSIERPAARTGEAPERVGDRDRAIHEVRQALLADVPADPRSRTREQAARYLLAYLVDWQYREDKVAWWEFFRLQGLADDDLVEEPKAVTGLAFLERVEVVRNRKTKKPTGSVVDRYEYLEQEMDIRRRDHLSLRDDTGFGKVVAIDRGRRRLEVRKGPGAVELHPSSAFAYEKPPNDAPARALLRVGRHVAARGLEGPRYRAGLDLLLRRPPCPGFRGGRDFSPAEQEFTVLPIQGPPGSGKTHTGAEMICDFVARGRRVGVTATSHRVIRNLLTAVARAAAARGLAVRLGQRVPPDQVKDLPEGGASAPPDAIGVFTDNDIARAAIGAREVDVVGGTAWLWSREDFENAVDVLVVDEAGQVSLANALASSQAAPRLVLLGDPQQLDQPQQGSHPDGVDVSALEHILAGRQTMPADLGMFLPTTYRLAPAICDFTSDVFYEGKLAPRPGLDAQRLVGAGPFTGAGLWLVEVAHDGNRNASDEEVDVVERLVSALLAPGVLCVESDPSSGTPMPPRQMTSSDILVVSPYNAQVSRLQERLESPASMERRGFSPGDIPAGAGAGFSPPQIRVGTVDKFQGQQAPVVIYSMATSNPEDAPRGMEFLFSLNRLNVATSRARCACIVVASARLFEPDCRTPRQMQLASALCRYRELAVAVPW